MDEREKSINFRVYTLASSLFKGANQYYGTLFGVGLPEMRVLSTLDSEGPLAAHQIVTLTAMDKALVSRVLTMLDERAYLTSSSLKTDPRRRTWRLSRTGRELVKRLRPEWQRREAIIQAGLSQAERKQLAVLLERLLVASEQLRSDEAAKLRGTRRRSADEAGRARNISGRAATRGAGAHRGTQARPESDASRP